MALQGPSSVQTMQLNCQKQCIKKSIQRMHKNRCANINNVLKKRKRNLDIKSRSWSSDQCKILVVDSKTNNMMGLELLSKLGITLNAHKPQGKTNHKIFNITAGKIIMKWVIQKQPHNCISSGRSKNHIAKAIFKTNYTPSQHNRRRVPLHLLGKVDNNLKK